MTTLALVSFNDDRDLPCRAANVDPNVFYPDMSHSASADVAIKTAKRICGGCPRRVACAEHAIAAGETLGIWGGLTAAERGEQVRLRGEGTSRPVPPPRQKKPFGWYRTGQAHNPAGAVANMLSAARAFLAGDLTRTAAAQAHGLRIGKLAEAVAILRYAPDMVGDVEAGWVQWHPAYLYAQAVKRWEAGSGDREQFGEVA